MQLPAGFAQFPDADENPEVTLIDLRISGEIQCIENLLRVKNQL